jgi:hypothetical protein
MSLTPYMDVGFLVMTSCAGIVLLALAASILASIIQDWRKK